MFLLGVSTNSAADWVNKVQNQLNNVVTQGSKLDETGDWDQQASWTNRGFPLWVRDETYRSDACELKEEQIVQNGQAAAAQAPAAKRKLPGEELTQRRRRLLLSPLQRKRSPVNVPTRAMEMRRRRAKQKTRRNCKSPKARQQRKR